MRHDPRARELAVADLVQDLARLLVPPVVLLRALASGQELERFARRTRVDRQQLVRGDERVPSEDGHVPGDPCGEHAALAHAGVEGAEISEAAIEELVEQLVVRDDLRRLALPLLVRATQLVHGVIEVRRGAVVLGPEDRLDRNDEEPGLVGLEVDPEHRGRERILDIDPVGLDAEPDPGHPPDPVPAFVHELDHGIGDGRSVRPPGMPVGHPPHVEDVGEVGTEPELDLQRDVRRVVVLDPDPFEQMAVDRSDPPDVDRLLGRSQDVTLVQVRVGQVDVGHVTALGGRGQQHEVAPVHRHAEMGQVPRVVRVEAEPEVAAVVEVALEIGVQEGLPFLHGQRLAREIGDQDRGGALLGLGRRRGGCDDAEGRVLRRLGLGLGVGLGHLSTIVAGDTRLQPSRMSTPEARTGTRTIRHPSPTSGVTASCRSNANSVGPEPETHTASPAPRTRS